MSFLKKIFEKKEEPITSHSDFWNWFSKTEKYFFKVIKDRQNIEKNFFEKVSPKLEELRNGYFFLAGMRDDNTAELILSAEGNTKNIVFVEELVENAPKIEGWKFTALKPELDIEDASIVMDGIKFNEDNLSFYSNEQPDYPDEINISIIHNDLNNENKRLVVTGIYLFLDNYLGELGFVNNIDNLKIIGKNEATKELVPIAKLKAFLNWRQKEFLEKYEGVRYDTEKDVCSVIEAEFENGKPLIATLNTQLLNWDRQASHPWISIMTIKYDGSHNNGMPNKSDYEILNTIEEEMMHILIDKEGYLNVGRQTAENEREIYFACKDYRKPSKVFYQIQEKYKDRFDIEYEIYKDKYWQTFERFEEN